MTSESHSDPTQAPESVDERRSFPRPVKWGITTLVVAVAIFGVMKLWQLADDIGHRDDVARLLGGEEIVETIQNPDRVTAQRIQLKEDWDEHTAEGGFDRVNYEPMAEPVEVSDANARRLAGWLTAGSSYDWDESWAKACIPSYGVKLVFERDDRPVEVWLCFECDIFSVYEPIEYEHARDASGGRYFDLIHDELADIMQSLFPEDEAIQEL